MLPLSNHCIVSQKKNSHFKWTTECQNSFDIIRQKLTSPPILAFPDFTKEFILDTGASDTGIGAVLSQMQDNGLERVVAYASRVLTKAERWYSVTRKELLAVVVFVNHFCQYLLGHHFLLRSDHSSLTWLRNFRNPEGQLARWLEKLQEYSFTIQHRPGKQHLNADALSRLSEVEVGSDVTVACGIFHQMTNGDLRSLQLHDPELALVLTAKEDGRRPTKEEVSGESVKTRKLIQIWEQLVLEKGILMRNFYDEHRGISFKQLVVPRALRQEILEELHAGSTGGHLGEEKTLGKLKQRFYWPGHFQDVQDWCKTCGICATRKTNAPKARAPLTSIQVGSPMQIISVDVMGPFPENNNGNKYILVAVDHFTKWSEAYSIPNQEAATIADVLTREWFFRYSPPETLHSDQGRQFESQLMYELCKILKIKKTRTSPYHPQGDGTAERFNRTLLNMLAIAAKSNHLHWESYIRPLCMAYNTSVHSSTGFTPFYLMFGREARLPIDLRFGLGDHDTVSTNEYVRRVQKLLDYAYDVVRTTLGTAQRRQKTMYDKRLHGDPFNVGDKVWLYSTVVPKDSHKKLHHPWTGPYTVVDRLSNVNYRIKRDTGNTGRTTVVHFDRLKLCPPKTRFPNECETAARPQQSNVGDGAMIVPDDDDDNTVNVHSDASTVFPDNTTDHTSTITNESPTDTNSVRTSVDQPVDTPRYPQRQRHEPDRLLPFVRH